MKLVIFGVLAVMATQVLGSDIKHEEETRNKREVQGNKTYVVSTIVHAPFVYLSNDSSLSGNDRFYGFVPDVLMNIFEAINARYTIQIVKDKKFGKYNTEGYWDGMIGEVLTKDADLAAAAITITSERLRVVNFLRVFSDTGLTILIKRPDVRTAHLSRGLGILSIVSYQVTLCLLAAYIVVSILLWLLERYSPYSWSSCYQRHEVGREEGTYFSIANTLWQSLTTLLWQGFERAPRAISARFLHAVWMIFAVLFLVAYTGSVIAQLLVADMSDRKWLPHPKINSIEDLAFQEGPNQFQYGCIANSSTRKALGKMPGPVFSRVNKYFHEQGSKVMVEDMKEGIDRILNEDYALIGEASIFTEHLNQNCNLMTVGDLIHKKTHGFALPINSELFMTLQLAVLKLEESGRIRDMEAKWFENLGRCRNEDTLYKEEVATLPSSATIYLNAWQLAENGMVTLGVFWGPLVLLVVGSLLAGLLLGAEILFYKHIDKRKYATTQREVLPQHEENIN